jgi:hypothetical protein
MPEPSEELREAAKLMRRLAGHMPPPPWYVGTYDVTTGDGSNVIASSGLTVRSQYVASWHSGVALAVAKLLDFEARVADGDGEEYLLNESGQLALATARAYLGTGEPT